METCDKYNLCCVIVNSGIGSKVMKIAKSCEVSGGTIFLGKGSTKNHILELLDLTDVRKEVVLFLAKEQIAKNALAELNKKLKFNKPNHGIAFTSSVGEIIGTRSCNVKNIESRGAENIMYNAIFTIVDRGNAESVIDAAVVAGSEGGTIVNARGSGIHEKSMLFSMTVEPEKEIVLILSEKEKTEAILKSIKENLEIEKPGNGVMFVIDTNETYGIFRAKTK